MVYLQARFAGLVSYGLSADLLSEILPLGRALHATTVRRQVQVTAQRLEDELGDERSGFITGCPADWAELPRPDLPLVVGRGGGYVHSCTQRTRRDGWFEVIAGKAMPADGRPSCFGYVQTYDSKPKRRLFEVLASRGCKPTSRSPSSPTAATTSPDLPRYLNPPGDREKPWEGLLGGGCRLLDVGRAVGESGVPAVEVIGELVVEDAGADLE